MNPCKRRRLTCRWRRRAQPDRVGFPAQCHVSGLVCISALVRTVFFTVLAHNPADRLTSDQSSDASWLPLSSPSRALLGAVLVSYHYAVSVLCVVPTRTLRCPAGPSHLLCSDASAVSVGPNLLGFLWPGWAREVGHCWPNKVAGLQRTIVGQHALCRAGQPASVPRPGPSRAIRQHNYMRHHSVCAGSVHTVR